jgi:hypothetical protein
MKIAKESCLAVVIDIQERLFPFIAGIEPLLKAQVKLIRGMQILGVPILVTEQYRKGLGQTIDSIIQLFGDKF